MKMGQTTTKFAKKVVSPLSYLYYGQTYDSNEDKSQALCVGVTPFVFKRQGSMYFDEDGDLAHEFYEEVADEGGYHRSKMVRLYDNLTPEGEVNLTHPRLHRDIPIVICEAPVLCR